MSSARSTRSPRLLLAWALGYEQNAHLVGPPELVEELGQRLERVAELHRGEPFTSVAAGRPPRDIEEEREAPPRQREPAGIRPERFARLVTLASVLIQAGRRGERLQVADVRSSSRSRPRSCARTSPCSTS